MQGILADILESVMGMGLIPADGRFPMFRGMLLFLHCIRRSNMPTYCGLLYWFLCLLTSSSLVLQYVTMIGLFGEASHQLYEKLDKAAADGEGVDCGDGVFVLSTHAGCHQEGCIQL